MSGWNRLFVFFLLLTCLPLLAVWAYIKPADGFATYACNEPYYATRSEAALRLESSDWKEHDYSTEPLCMMQLREVASGKMYDEALSAWWSSLWVGAVAIGAGFLTLYLIGFGVGWVWRGFKKAKQ